VHGANRNPGGARKGFRKGSGGFLSTLKLKDGKIILSTVSFRGGLVETKACFLWFVQTP